MVYQWYTIGVEQLRTEGRETSKETRNLFTLRVCEAPAHELSQEFSSSVVVADYFRALIGKADREMFYVVHLDSKNVPLKVELSSLGDIDTSAVYPRQVMRSALLFCAQSLIFVHNHPTGATEPSLCDKEITRDLIAAAQTLQIRVLDHVIVGPRKDYFSFADQGLVDAYAAERRV